MHAVMLLQFLWLANPQCQYPNSHTCILFICNTIWTWNNKIKGLYSKCRCAHCWPLQMRAHICRILAVCPFRLCRIQSAVKLHPSTTGIQSLMLQWFWVVLKYIIKIYNFSVMGILCQNSGMPAVSLIPFLPPHPYIMWNPNVLHVSGFGGDLAMTWGAAH